MHLPSIVRALVACAKSRRVGQRERRASSRLTALEPLEARQLLASIAIGNPDLAEGNSGTKVMTFDVDLSNPVAQVVTVRYATQDGTATAGEDYAAATGTVSFAANTTHASITVQIKGDTKYEPDEVLLVNLSAPVNASIAGGMGVGIIKNDDAPDGNQGGGNTTPGPYPGPSAPNLPGTIETENFDTGDDGVSYHDREAGNFGGAYRSTGVDVEPTSDTAGGYDVNYTHAGEWMNYTVNVATAGTYAFSARVSSPAAGGAFHIEVDGVNRTGALAVPNTGGWQKWQTITSPGVTLASGKHVLKLVMDTNGASGFVGNFNYIQAALSSTPAKTSTSYFTSPLAMPAIIEAEKFDRGGEGVAYHDTTAGNFGKVFRTDDVDLQTVTGARPGYAVAWTRAGEWLSYTVSVATAGTYSFSARVASLGVGGKFHLEVDGTDRTGPMGVPDTGGWQNWATVTKTGISLTAGTHVLRLVMDSAGSGGFVGNFDYLRVTKG